MYNEEKELVEKNSASLTSQKISMGTDVFLMIFDGLTDKNRGLFGHIEKLISFEKNKKYKKMYENWKTKEETSILYKIGKYNGFPFVLACKTKNAGKKDSLIIGEKFCMDISKIEDIPIDNVSVIFHTDGDSLADENCLNELLKSLVNDKNLDGVSGMLRAYGKESNSLKGKSFVAMQNFQYQFLLIVRRQTESLMNATTCLPGCCNMIRMGDKTVSTDECYGSMGDEDAAKEDAVLAPTNPYSSSKVAAEFMVKSYYVKSFKMNTVISRSNNIYGGNQYYDKVIPKFVRQLMNGKKMTIHGDGSPLTTYLHFKDIVSALDIVLHKGVVSGSIYNIGGKAEISNNDLAQNIALFMDKVPGEVMEYIPCRPFNDLRYHINCDAIESLGWREMVDFDDGLKETIEWIKNHPGYFE